MQEQGLVKHIGLSNVTPTQVAEARKITEIVCVQNEYNIAHRADDAMIDALARDGIAYVPFFPLGGFTPLQSSTLSDVAASLGATPNAGSAGVAVTTFTEYFVDSWNIFCCAFTGEYGRRKIASF